MPLLTILWANKELVAKCLGIALIAFLLYWFLWHNPHRIKALETTIAEQSRQIDLRDSALELQGVIRREHERINREENENLRRIRVGYPSRTGYIIMPGVLPDLYESNVAEGK